MVALISATDYLPPSIKKLTWSSNLKPNSRLVLSRPQILNNSYIMSNYNIFDKNAVKTHGRLAEPPAPGPGPGVRGRIRGQSRIWCWARGWWGHRKGLQEPEVDKSDRTSGLQGIVRSRLQHDGRHLVWPTADGCYQAWWTTPALCSLWPNQVAGVEQAPAPWSLQAEPRAAERLGRGRNRDKKEDQQEVRELQAL